jgi:DNA (cytosine-5)-methyltransferase 1
MRCWPGFVADDLVTDHVCKATPRDYTTFALMQPGDRYPEALVIAERRHRRALAAWKAGRRSGGQPRRKDFVPPYRNDIFPEKWRKLDPRRPSWTVTAHLAKDTYSHIHHDSSQARMISLREAARLQSFPDGFKFVGNIGDCFRQIGNAVPPLLAHGIGRRIRRLLRATAEIRRPRLRRAIVAARSIRRWRT